MPDKIPARVAALAEKIGDSVLDWKEYPNGDITIVFNSKGKRTFQRESVTEESVTGAKEQTPAPVQTKKPKEK